MWLLVPQALVLTFILRNLEKVSFTSYGSGTMAADILDVTYACLWDLRIVLLTFHTTKTATAAITSPSNIVLDSMGPEDLYL